AFVMAVGGPVLLVALHPRIVVHPNSPLTPQPAERGLRLGDAERQRGREIDDTEYATDDRAVADVRQDPRQMGPEAREHVDVKRGARDAGEDGRGPEPRQE